MKPDYKTILVCLSLLWIAHLKADAQRIGEVTGTLIDSAEQKKMIAYATVSIYKGKDTVLSNYKLSDEKGLFRISGLVLDADYRLVITAWQYLIERRTIRATSANPSINLGQILLNTAKNQLKEVVIAAERPPVIVRKDTIEFNAESFKTLPTAVVEDLLKKLPGVVVGANGAIEVNGRGVSKILVDGKEFFGGDQQIATKNLPANIIDKVQVADDEEAKRRNPDLIAANTPQVINLKLKRAIKQGAFGKLYAGGGLKDHYELGGIVNFFRDTTQLSVLGYGNNLNKPGFSIADVQRIGGFSRSGVSSMSVNQDGAFSLDGIGFGGLSGGVSRNFGGGANFNTLTKKGTKINGKYFFGRVNSSLIQFTNDNQRIGQNAFITDDRLNNESGSDNHNFGGRIELKLDPATRLVLTPTITLNPFHSSSAQIKSSKSAEEVLINSTKVDNIRETDNNQFNLVADLWKDFKKLGRYLNMNLLVGNGRNLMNTFNSSITTFYPKGNQIIIDQLRKYELENLNGSLTAQYAEPLSKKVLLSLILAGTYLNNLNALSTLVKDPTTQQYDMLLPDFTQTVKQSGLKTNTRFKLRWTLDKNWTIQPAVVYNTINLMNHFSTATAFKQHYDFLNPAINIRYKSISMDYNATFSEPQLQYIQPVVNNVDPLSVQNGNSKLLPAKTHQLFINTFRVNPKRSLNFNINLNASVKNNGVILSRTISANGVQTTTPINVNGVWQGYFGGGINKDFKSPKRQLTVSTGYYSNYTKNPVEINGIRSTVFGLSFNPRAGVRLNLNDVIEISETYSLGINHTYFQDAFFTDRKALTQTNDSELIIRYPKKVVFETNYKLQVNNQQIAGYQNNIHIWNAGVTYLFLKNDRGQLKFTVNDIVNNGIRRFVYISDNSIRDVQNNNIGRYGLLTFTYNIQNFGGKVGGKERFFGF